MEIKQSIDGTPDENNLAQQYYDFAVIVIKPKLKEYLNTDVPKKVLKQRIKECRDYFIKLNNIQYEISKISRGKILKYTKTGDAYPEEYEVEAIDTQARNWLNRLSTTISFMVIKQSEYDVKNAFTRDIIIFILSVLFGAIISWNISKKEIKLPYPQINCPCSPVESVLNTNPDGTDNDK